MVRGQNGMFQTGQNGMDFFLDEPGQNGMRTKWYAKADKMVCFF